MLAYPYTRAPRKCGRGFIHGLIRSSSGLAGLALAAALLGGCAASPPAPVAGVHPADADAPVARTAYRGVIAPYSSQRPRDPSPWRENNERVAPEAKP